MKAPITPAQVWAAIAESSGWDVATKLEQSHGGVPCVATTEIRRLMAERDAVRAQLAESISNHEACKSANSMLLDTIAELEKQESAESKDAERYRWLAAYLVSNDTLHDDELIACSSVGAMTAFIDAKGAK